MDKEWIATLIILGHLGEMGYKEVWLGAPNPHCPFASSSNAVVAAPKIIQGGWPALWGLNFSCGKISCGNGLKKADNAFFNWNIKPIRGQFKINVDGTWTIQTEKEI